VAWIATFTFAKVAKLIRYPGATATFSTPVARVRTSRRQLKFSFRDGVRHLVLGRWLMAADRGGTSGGATNHLMFDRSRE